MLTATAAENVDEQWILGDLVAHGPQPAVTIQRLMSLPRTRFVRGNTDRYVTRGDVSPSIPADPEARSRNDLVAILGSTASHAWARGAVTTVGAYDWLDSLPVEERIALPDGTRVLLVHASPGTDDGSGIKPAMPDEEIRDLGVADCGADLLFVGHTHVPLDRTVDNVRIVNPGSVSLPLTPEQRAMWILLTADDSGYTIERRYAAYDHGDVVRAIDDMHHPGAEWLRFKFSVMVTDGPPSTRNPACRQR